MAYLTQPDYVKYVCSCGQLKPITNLYFCRHCLKIRCGFCICHEVDSHYCANCLENMPSSEARLKKNRCSSCFDCPSCFHTLSTRATFAQPRQDPAAGDAKVENKQAKKMYYLSCFNCRWTSRDVGIPDQPVASGGWPERTNPYTARINQLLDYYKAIAQQEKQEKLDRERKKFAIRGKYITLTDKTGLTGAMARNIAGLPSSESSSSAIANFVPSVASAEVEELPEDYHLREVNLKQGDTLPPINTNGKCLSYHVPEVKIISHESVKAGQVADLLLKVTNPTAHEMTLRILRPADSAEEVPAPPEDQEPRSIEKSLEKSLNLEKDTSWSKVIERKPEMPTVSQICVPEVTLTLAQRDDAAEYDDDPQHETSDIILWRKSNKLALRLKVTTDPTAEVGKPAQVAFRLQYSYRNTVPPSAQSVQHRDHTLNTTVILDLGSVCE
ncbi:jg26146 [Pararge aegeria aegeria]|uniref:Dynactin subunit 4 n=1 Tax=Pararge aegeria aegeria TaxID=348720 RepID=A0A8S4S047_9NEOP|nr:jg26146 [Pararge aegeria aegeria]